MSNAKHSLYRHFCIQNSSVGGIRYNFYDITLLHILMTDNELVIDGNLLKCLLIHENTTALVFIKILIGTTLNDDVLQFLTDVEATLQNATIGNVLHLDNHNCVTLTWLSVLEIDAHPNTTVHANSGAFLNVL